MYKCEVCGFVFEEGEEKRKVETHGFIDNRYETWSCCPKCGGSFDEVECCDLCREDEAKSKVHNGVCEKCIAKCEKDLDICLAVGERMTQSIELNGLLASLFEIEDIEKILIEKLKQDGWTDFKEFIYEDVDIFAAELSNVRCVK